MPKLENILLVVFFLRGAGLRNGYFVILSSFRGLPLEKPPLPTPFCTCWYQNKHGHRLWVSNRRHDLDSAQDPRHSMSAMPTTVSPSSCLLLFISLVTLSSHPQLSSCLVLLLHKPHRAAPLLKPCSSGCVQPEKSHKYGTWGQHR